MKIVTKTSLASLIFSIILLMQSCKKDDSISVGETQDSREQSLQTIKELGFSTQDIKETDSTYVVEGDIVLSKSRLNEMKSGSLKTFMSSKNTPSGKIGQAHTNNIITDNLTNVTITTEVYDTRWFYALRDAVAAWNSISNCRINLIHVYEYPVNRTADIVIRKVNLGNSAFGQGDWPKGNGKPGTFIN